MNMYTYVSTSLFLIKYVLVDVTSVAVAFDLHRY